MSVADKKDFINAHLEAKLFSVWNKMGVEIHLVKSSNLAVVVQ